MNLSKTAKRFLSSTMAIALAGGSVLVFRNSAMATPPETPDQADTVDFTGTVGVECALLATPSTETYTETFGTVGTVGSENRTTGMSATTTVDYDCNSDTVSVAVSGQATTSDTPANATDLVATHQWSWIGTTTSTETDFSPSDTTLSSSEATDTNGDISIDIKSAWTTSAEEFFESTYTASLTLTVTAQ